ncbi:MAG TPA: YoaK family protein, partial [Xanthobacteraceae bacterium]|nr:YoaK family protein [Xanthobacteraceae bacterium]
MLPIVLSTTAGAVDVIGFLALGGLFTAHITGNLVVLAAHYVTGRFSQIAPLLSVPVFVVVLGIVTVLFANKAPRRARRTLLILHAGLLMGFLALGGWLGPFTNPDSGIAVSVGMIGVAAMATQNALVRLELPGFPSTAVMTINITQLAIDLALLVQGKGDPPDIARARRGARLTFPSVIGSVAGCAAGGFLELYFG